MAVEQFLPLDCTAKARVKGVLFHRHRYERQESLQHITFLFMSSLKDKGAVQYCKHIILFYLHSAKGGAVSTGCSDLYDVIY